MKPIYYVLIALVLGGLIAWYYYANKAKPSVQSQNPTTGEVTPGLPTATPVNNPLMKQKNSYFRCKCKGVETYCWSGIQDSCTECCSKVNG